MISLPLFTKKSVAGLTFALLPVTLFLPVGFMYFWIFIATVAAALNGNLREAKRSILTNPILIPAALLFLIVFSQAIFLSSENDRRWSGMTHYFIFIFFFLFLLIGPDRFRLLAKQVFYCSASVAALIFYLAKIGLIPDWYIFKNFLFYAGNRSIAIGIFLAIAAGWMLNDAQNEYSPKKIAVLISGYFFIGAAVFLFATTRTGLLLLFALSAVAIVRNFSMSKKYLLLASSMIIFLVLAAGLKSVSSQRLIETISAVTSEQPQKSESGEMVRLQFFQKTGEMILEKPLLGHGIGSWRQQYPIRAEGLMTAQMSTPHNDYLLCTAELGLVGLITLLAIFFSLIRAAVKAPFKRGNLLLMISVAMAVGSMFNAILRDWRFGVPFMLLLAIAYRESQQEPTEVD